jgi:hypothetical protein
MQYEMALKDFLGHNMELFLKWLFILAFVILGIYLFHTTTPQQEASGLERCFPLLSETQLQQYHDN